MGRALVYLNVFKESKYVNFNKASRPKFGINHRGSSQPAKVKEKDLKSAEKPEKPKPKKKKERTDHR